MLPLGVDQKTGIDRWYHGWKQQNPFNSLIASRSLYYIIHNNIFGGGVGGGYRGLRRDVGQRVVVQSQVHLTLCGSVR